jgi:dolichyl-phosphate beta-glucosyltransferase
MPQLSVVIPAYNEEGRLPDTLISIYEFLSSHQKSFEILVVDDGSSDDTAEAVKIFGQHNDGVRLVSYKPNQGKGYAVRAGVMAADGELILFDDADGASPIQELVRLEGAIVSGADVAIGSRAKPDSDRQVKALAYRKHIGNVFNFIVQSLLIRGIYDTQCGFKLFTKSAAKDIFSVAQVNGYGFDVEVLHIAQRKGYKVSEVAIDWTNIDGSKVNVWTDSPKMFTEVLGIKLRSLLGAYGKAMSSKAMPGQSAESGRVKSR